MGWGEGEGALEIHITQFDLGGRGEGRGRRGMLGMFSVTIKKSRAW